ncbi:MAG: hypothetical protein HQ546_01050 [Planctomycetes bacterium]|nr:hypothetical protein [Planctomycetota bacterium]
MDSLTLVHSLGKGSPAKIRFADADARAELVAHMDELCLPADREGPDVIRLKTVPSHTLWRCRLGDRWYYVNHFYRRGLRRALARVIRLNGSEQEFDHICRLAQRGVPMPEVLATGRLGGLSWMVSRAVAPAMPADLWHQQRAGSTDPAVQRQVRDAIDAVAELTARMHNAGVLHDDLHAGNILLQDRDGTVVPMLTDLHRMRCRYRLSRRVSAKNLAMLMHGRWHLTTRTQRMAFLKRYLQVTSSGGSLYGWAEMVEYFAEAHKRKLYRSRDRHISGDNKYFTGIRLHDGWRGRVVLAGKWLTKTSSALAFTIADWQTALAEPAGLFDSPDAVVVNDSPGSLVIRRPLTVGEHTLDVYVTRNNLTGRGKAFLNAFHSSRAMRAFRLGHTLLTRRIPTARPLAALERRKWPMVFDNILITEAVASAQPLKQFLNRWFGDDSAGHSVRQELSRGLLLQLGRLLKRLHGHGFAHRDMKADNLMVQWTAAQMPQIVLVDLDVLSQHRRVSRRQMFADLMRLNVSLLECPSVSRTGRLRMLLAYLRQPACGAIHFKPYWHQLQRWSAKKLSRQITSRRKKQRRIETPKSFYWGSLPNTW